MDNTKAIGLVFFVPSLFIWYKSAGLLFGLESISEIGRCKLVTCEIPLLIENAFGFISAG